MTSLSLNFELEGSFTTAWFYLSQRINLYEKKKIQFYRSRESENKLMLLTFLSF